MIVHVVQYTVKYYHCTTNFISVGINVTKVKTFVNQASAPTLVPHVMDLVKDDPAHLPHDLRTTVQHAPQDLKQYIILQLITISIDIFYIICTFIL